MMMYLYRTDWGRNDAESPDAVWLLLVAAWLHSHKAARLLRRRRL